MQRSIKRMKTALLEVLGKTPAALYLTGWSRLRIFVPAGAHPLFVPA